MAAAKQDGTGRGHTHQSRPQKAKKKKEATSQGMMSGYTAQGRLGQQSCTRYVFAMTQEGTCGGYTKNMLFPAKTNRSVA